MTSFPCLQCQLLLSKYSAKSEFESFVTLSVIRTAVGHDSIRELEAVFSP